ncbi:hypothetical protein V2154_23895 [Ewingella sp. CoE-038-23]|uniref:hypothetical protein n=1 Tax=Ewingella docleensis TaxID=3118588 RepID=UPI0033653D89
MPASQKSRKRKPSKSGKNRTSLLEHKKVGSELRPAFSQFEGEVIFSHWSDERLPEILWAAVIRVIERSAPAGRARQRCCLNRL